MRVKTGGKNNRRKGVSKSLLTEIGSHEGNDDINFVLDIATHGRGFEHPTSTLRPPLEVMRIALQSLDFDYAFVRIIIPAEEPLVAGVGKPEINECVRIALGRRVVVDVEESSLINNSSDFGTNQADFTE
jgi:hypothetical protein